MKLSTISRTIISNTLLPSSLVAFVSLGLTACSHTDEREAQNNFSFQQSYCPAQISEQLDFQALKFELVAEAEPITSGFAIFEGPLWYKGSLLMSHVGYATSDAANPANGVILKDAQVVDQQVGYGGNGMALNPQGEPVIARHKDGSITELNSGRILVAQYQGKRFNSPNDLIFSSAGDLYFSDPDWQAPKPHPQAQERAYHLSAKGELSAFATGQVEKPNGLMLSKDESQLYLGGTNGLFKFALIEGAVAEQGQKVAGIPGGVDGMTKDCAGNIYVTAEGKVFVLNSEDKVIGEFELAGVTNLAFGGKDGRTLYATTLGEVPQVYRAQSNIPGFPF